MRRRKDTNEPSDYKLDCRCTESEFDLARTVSRRAGATVADMTRHLFKAEDVRQRRELSRRLNGHDESPVDCATDDVPAKVEVDKESAA